VSEGSLVGVDAGVPPSTDLGRLGKGGVCEVQGHLVVGRLEQRQRPLDERLQVFRRALRPAIELDGAHLDLSGELADTILRTPRRAP
jgi:hypothetical protein